MTWTRLAPTSIGVTAWEYALPGKEPRIRVGVSSSYADLSLDDAASLGGYLLSHAQKDEDQ